MNVQDNEHVGESVFDGLSTNRLIQVLNQHGSSYLNELQAQVLQNPALDNEYPAPFELQGGTKFLVVLGQPKESEPDIYTSIKVLSSWVPTGVIPSLRALEFCNSFNRKFRFIKCTYDGESEFWLDSDFVMFGGVSFVNLNLFFTLIVDHMRQFPEIFRKLQTNSPVEDIFSIPQQGNSNEE